jgi:hypothetical protein
MSQIPPQVPPMSPPPVGYYPPAPKQNNIAAIISLITGILGCIPGVSLIAIVLGIVGLSKAGKPNVGGKGLAIAGIILGVLGTLGWAGGGLAIGLGARKLIAAGAPARAVAKQFATDIGNGDADAAIKECSASMSPDTVRAAVTAAQPWGPFKDSTFVSIGLNDQNGVKTATVGGSVIFANANKPFNATLIQEGDVYKISEFHFGQ